MSAPRRLLPLQRIVGPRAARWRYGGTADISLQDRIPGRPPATRRERPTFRAFPDSLLPAIRALLAQKIRRPFLRPLSTEGRVTFAPAPRDPFVTRGHPQREGPDVRESPATVWRQRSLRLFQIARPPHAESLWRLASVSRERAPSSLLSSASQDPQAVSSNRRPTSSGLRSPLLLTR